MKSIYRVLVALLVLFVLAACSHNEKYTVLSTLDDGTIKIEYNGLVYTETGDFDGNPPGKVVFRLKYGEICETVAYDAYIDGNTLYLKAKQPFWADVMAVSFVLTADGKMDNGQHSE